MSTANAIAIDRMGRLVIPKEIREAAGIEPGVPLIVTCREGRIEIEPQKRPVRIVKRGRLQVAQAVEDGEALTRESVERTQQRLRKREES
jgi:AbrB family looped-hinge helix DNA binding protein